MKKSPILVFILFFILLSLSASITLLDYYGIMEIQKWIMIVSRWLVIGILFWFAAQKRSLTGFILISMLAGIEFGCDLPGIAVKMDIISQVFLRLIKTIIAPLLFGTLVVGIAGHSNLKQVGRIGWKSILYFEVVTTMALFIGLAAINISHAGVGIQLPPATDSGDLKVLPPQSARDLILHIFPENFAKSIAEGNVLQVVVFSILFGIGCAMAAEKYRNPMVRFAEALSEVMFKFTNIIMYFAPFAVFGAIAFTVGHLGLGIMVKLIMLLITLYVSLIVFIVFILIPICLILKIPIKRFFNAVLEPASIAFATTSSEAALPLAMENMEKFGVPRRIVSFVIPLGYSFNLDGTTLYLSMASIFVAQAAGINMPFGTQLVLMLTLMLTSKGVAGVSRATIVILLGTVSSFGLPTMPVFVLLGIDALMDMGRTATNVIGNCLASAVMAKWEKE
ncbi:MAG: cation:dicarboxylase symporter family transporter [Bacteroidetes bacterium]|nr:cation:dicarboxylase symporter family transporter [Bacteroidota bacterium]